MLLAVCPNLAVDRILQVENFEASKVQRTRFVIVQPGGKGSNVARVFHQLGGEVAVVGFVGRRNGSSIVEPLRATGIHVDAVTAYEGESRTCTIVCDPQSTSHPTVINEESPEIDPHSAAKLMGRIERWIPRIDAVLTTGSLSRGLPTDFYAEILARARSRGKLTAIDATGQVLREGLLVRPLFMKPNAEEFRQFIDGQTVSMLARHTAITFGKAGAALIHNGNCIYGSPPRVNDINPIGAGDAFVAGYLKCLLDGGHAEDCFRWAMAAAASDAATLRPGFIDYTDFQSLAAKALPVFGSNRVKT
jgi:1-phosphofructokinase family hexose kinase